MQAGSLASPVASERYAMVWCGREKCEILKDQKEVTKGCLQVSALSQRGTLVNEAVARGILAALVEVHPVPFTFAQANM